MAAFQTATRAVVSAPAIAAPAPVVTPAPAPPPLAIEPIAPMAPAAPLARLSSGSSSAPDVQRAEPQPQASPDLDALADYVLDRLRGELRDGRERLGFLLDDSY